MEAFKNRTRHGVFYAGVMLVLLSVAACTAQSDEFGSATGTAASEDPTAVPSIPAGVATFSSPGEGGDSALLKGVLVEEGGCVYVTISGSSARWIPVFRQESSPLWSNGQLTFDGVTYEAGAVVGLGGGESSVGRHPVPTGCKNIQQWRVFDTE